MADFEGTIEVDGSGPELFAYLSDVRNLPRYFARMASAEPGDGDEVHTTAQLPDGSAVTADAWFRVDRETQQLAWGSEGPNSYRGLLRVLSGSAATTVQVQLHTTRVATGDPEVQSGIDETLAAIQTLADDLPHR